MYRQSVLSQRQYIEGLEAEAPPVWSESLVAMNHKQQSKDAFLHFQLVSVSITKEDKRQRTVYYSIAYRPLSSVCSLNVNIILKFKDTDLCPKEVSAVTSAAATAVSRLATLLAKLGLNSLVAILALLPALLHPPMVAFFFFAAAGWAVSSFFCCLFLVRLLALLSAHVLYPLPLQGVAEVQALLVLGEGGIGVGSSQSVAVSGEIGKEEQREDKGLNFGWF
nr:hypothetical protein Iba_chr12dCG6630 [Ipomoea batatas]